MPSGRKSPTTIYAGYRNMKSIPFSLQELHKLVDNKGGFCDDEVAGYGIGRAFHIIRSPFITRQDGSILDIYEESHQVACPDCHRHRVYIFTAVDTSTERYPETRSIDAKE